MYTIWDQESYNQISGKSKHASELEYNPVIDKYILTSGTFSLGSASRSRMPSGMLEDLGDNLDSIWQVYVTTMQERHSEAIYHENVFSDTHLTFTTGAEPIELSLQGFVATNPVYNARLDFYAFYQLLLRGTAQKELNINMHFCLQNTKMDLYLRSLQAEIVPDMPDFTQISLIGVGLRYEIHKVVINHE